MTTRTTTALLGSLAVALAVATPTLAQQKATAPQNATITKEDLMADIEFLATEGLRGRDAGTTETAIAADFVRTRFQRFGLKPVAGSYYQRFGLLSATLAEGNHLEVPGAALARRLAPGQEYYPLRFSATARATAQVVFVGFGISPEDYAGLTPGRSIVLALDHEPGEFDPNSPFDGIVTSVASDPLRKTLLAQEKGAIGILFVADVHNHPGPVNIEAGFRSTWPPPGGPSPRPTLADWVERVRIPAAQISPALAETLIGAAGPALRELAAGAETVRPPRALAAQVDLSVSVDRHLSFTRNVVALLEGADPTVREEHLIVCGHHDHLGVDAVQTFYGADDNASGVAGVVEIAEAFVAAARAGQRPRRSIIFAAWDAEEKGLLGAWAYVERPLAPLEKTVAVLNLDMIARDEEVPASGEPKFRGLEPQTAESNANSVNVLGHTRFPFIRAEVERANQPFGLRLKWNLDNNASQLLRRSDHWPFMQRGVPALWFLTGLHPDYHTTWDRPERINAEKMERIVRMAHQMTWNLAQADAVPRK